MPRLYALVMLALVSVACTVTNRSSSVSRQPSAQAKEPQAQAAEVSSETPQPLPPPPSEEVIEVSEPAPVQQPEPTVRIKGPYFVPWVGTVERFSDGVSPVDSRFHPSLQQRMYDRNRTGYRVKHGPIQEGNTFLPWVTFWGEGQMRLRSLSLLVKDASGEVRQIYQQRWSQNEPIAGGRWQNTSTTWYAQGLEMGRNISAFRREQGDVVFDTRGKPDEVHHVWLSTWPHPKVPDGTTEIGVRVVFAIYGDGLMHFGCDRYAHDAVTNPIMSGTEQNVQEILHSSTFDESFNDGAMQDRTIWTPIGRR